MKKVKYGLKNVHYAIVTETTDSTTGEVTSSYGAVKAWPGSVSLSLDPNGDDTPFYADDGVYYMIGNNSGYTGSLDTALIPEDIHVNVLGETKDSNDVITETSDAVKKYIALMFEFALDESGRRFMFYRCSLARPSVSGQTKADSIEVQTEPVNITATPRPDDHAVKSYCDKDSAAYDGWYTSVYDGADSEEE